MNELGKRTVSRSGRSGRSAGIWSGRSGSTASIAGRSGSDSVISGNLPDSSALHVDEQRGRAAALRHQAVALLLDLTRLFAVLAADRERQGAQALLTDFLAALETEPVGRFFEAPKRFFYLIQRLRLHLDEGEFDFILNVQLGAFRRVQHALPRVASAFRANVAHAPLDFVHDLAAALLEDALEFVVP